MKYVLINKICELTGYTKAAVYAKVKRGVWRENVHYKKAPDERLLFIPTQIEKWVEGTAA